MDARNPRLLRPEAPGLPEPYASLAARAGDEALRRLSEAVDEGGGPGDALLRAGVPAGDILAALAEHSGLPAVAYDERLPVPPALAATVEPAMLADGRWFPLAEEADGTIVVILRTPGDPDTLREVERCFPGRKVAWRVALRRDIRRFAEDFLHRASGAQVGVERTCLAFWRNTMAHWRTKLACYRTDMAKARTSLNILRWGLGLVVLANTLARTDRLSDPVAYWSVAGLGLAVSLACFWSYLSLRLGPARPPRVQTLVEVTAAAVQFLENYHFIEPDPAAPRPPGKPTMLGRLGELLARHSTILDPSAAFRERITLARERNVLAAQRTVCACYRTIAARARTGLSLWRTGTTLACLGLGLIKYFGFDPKTVFDAALVVIGILMVADGAVWYWPVRREHAETPRCIEWGGDED